MGRSDGVAAIIVTFMVSELKVRADLSNGFQRELHPIHI